MVLRSGLDWHDSGVVWCDKMVMNEEKGRGEGVGKDNWVISNILVVPIANLGNANISSYPRATCRGPLQQHQHDCHGQFRSHHYPSRTASDLTAASCAMEPPTSPVYKNGTHVFIALLR
ncbi:hypothetical protein AAZV13_03G129700 [Glycine max]